MKTSKSYEINYEEIAEAFNSAFRKFFESALGQLAEKANTLEWQELKQVYIDYRRATIRLHETNRAPWSMSLSEPDLRFQKQG